MGPSFACLFVGWLEQRIFDSYDGTKPDMFKRYIDDCVGTAWCHYDELTNFISYVNDYHPAIKFTHEISATKVAFLDIELSISGNSISTSIHYKPTDAHTYLTYNSSHPSACKQGIPYSQLLRLRRICSDDDDFSNQAVEMMSFFNHRGYPSSVTNHALRRITGTSQTDALEPTATSSTDRVPLMTFHPTTTKVARVIKKNYHILQTDPSTSEIFQLPPLCAYRRDASIRDLLVHSSLQPISERPKGSTTPCHRPRCKTCKHVVSLDLLKGPSGYHVITDSFSCISTISTNVIYGII
ncbi:uncharacterized protein LOC117119643, partial [Anneissia japonica]|uniref:uncharacterized protein LOC117119643 n=1 Tax=Anneissia japonica TaxID=1529436 RepID=UPI0014254B19